MDCLVVVGQIGARLQHQAGHAVLGVLALQAQQVVEGHLGKQLRGVHTVRGQVERIAGQIGHGAAGQGGVHARAARTMLRAMMSCWICVVPSYRRNRRTSR